MSGSKSRGGNPKRRYYRTAANREAPTTTALVAVLQRRSGDGTLERQQTEGQQSGAAAHQNGGSPERPREVSGFFKKRFPLAAPPGCRFTGVPLFWVAASRFAAVPERRPPLHLWRAAR